MNTMSHDEIRQAARAALKVDPAYAAEVRALAQPQAHRFLLWMFLHVTLWIAAAVLIFAAGHWLLHLLAVLVLSNQLHAMTVLQHECGHKSAFRSQLANLWVGRFLAWFIVFPFTSFTECHKHHHRYIGDAERDPDDWNYAAGPFWMFLRIATFAERFTWFSLVRYGREVRNRVLRELCFNLLSMAALFALFAVLGLTYEFLLVFVVPLLMLMFVINPISRGYEHFPMATTPEMDPSRFDLSRNTITVTSRIVGLLWANINYHVEHHVYPGVPFFNLPRLHVLLHDKSFLRDRWLLQRMFREPIRMPVSVDPATRVADR